MLVFHRSFLFLVVMIMVSTFTVQSKKTTSSSFRSAAFVSSSAPAIVLNTPASPATHHAVASCYGVCSLNRQTTHPQLQQQQLLTTLHAKKKKNSDKKTSSPTTKNGKLQVQMLKHVEGTGNIGDVILVAPAFFENKLRKTQSAKLISDAEVTEMRENREAALEQRRSAADKVASKMESATITFSKKAGPDGHLFGGIKTKDILAELQLTFPDDKDALSGKQVKVLSVTDEEGTALKHDIKTVGEFHAKVSLLTDVSVDVTVSVKTD